ncbi:MAG: ABC transporter ATP-binding protein [Candidatus Paceibacterota bacterium]
MEQPIIKLNNVSLWYEKGKTTELKALKNITIEIKKGDYVAFFGPSGCGKTTILYAISGIDRFQEGSILINGRDISPLTNQELAIFRQTGIGIVFQQFNLVPSLTVLKNVALPMLFVGISSEKADKEALKLLKRLDLLDLQDRFPSELSGGQQQRVGIARALANDPPIIIADEPLGNLDSINAKKVLEFLKELNEKDGRTIIMVTHEAWSLRDVKTIYHMKDGTITEIEKTTPETIAQSIASRLNKQLSSSNGEDKGKDSKGGDANAESISAHLLANFLLRGYSLDEISRFELFVNERFSNKIDKKEFHELINKPFKDGGVGLWKKKAERVTEYLEEVIDKKHSISSICELIEKTPEAAIFDEIKNVRQWLIEGYTGELNASQILALDQVISDRIRNYISREKVVQLLDLSSNKFGVGLSFRAAQILAEKLELLLEGVPNDKINVNISGEKEISKDTDATNFLKKL